MSKHKYRYKNYNIQPQQEPEPQKASKTTIIKHYATKQNIFIAIVLAFALFYFAQFVYSNINPLSINYEYTHDNIIPPAWIQAMQFLNQTKSQYNTSILTGSSYVLSWWDYGDWINWFGNSKSVLRGDNQQPELDYATAYQFINGNTTTLKQFMKKENASLFLISTDDFQKFQALNYLSCIYLNETNVNNAVGSSACERANNPIYMIFPQKLTNINDYCSITTANTTYIKASGNNGDTYCLQEIQTTYNGKQIDGKIYSPNGTIINNTNLVSVGVEPLNNVNYEVYLLLYTPLNTTTCQMQTGLPKFYYSNLYMGVFEGCLSGFKQVYPANGAFNEVRIYSPN